MLCNIKPVPFHESDEHIFAKIPGGGGPDPRSPPLDPPMVSINLNVKNDQFYPLPNIPRFIQPWGRRLSKTL